MSRYLSPNLPQAPRGYPPFAGYPSPSQVPAAPANPFQIPAPPPAPAPWPPEKYEEKDLIPFEYKVAASSNVPTCTEDGTPCKIKTFIKETEQLVVYFPKEAKVELYWYDGNPSDETSTSLPLALPPLQYVEGIPVYYGSRLYHKEQLFTVVGANSSGHLTKNNTGFMPASELTWKRPIREGFLVIDRHTAFLTEEHARNIVAGNSNKLMIRAEAVFD